jgi:AcrR family transcriptional regulator
VQEEIRMGKRGDELHEHILFAAKDVFLEMGFERASMDVISARARTSKRTLYAHFESKEKLYLAVIELVRGLYLEKLKTPADYAGDTTEALVLFCGRFLELLLWAPAIGMCRLGIAEAERFPDGSAQFYHAMFTTAHERLSAFIGERWKLKPKAAALRADALLGTVLHPRFPRALFGIDEVSDERPDDEKIARAFDLAPIRKAAADAALLVRAR